MITWHEQLKQVAIAAMARENITGIAEAKASAGDGVEISLNALSGTLLTVKMTNYQFEKIYAYLFPARKKGKP